MRRLDSLELERAQEEIKQLFREGKLTLREALPVLRAFKQRGESEEAAILFEKSCLTRSKTITINIVEEFQDTDDEAAWLPFDEE